MGTRFGRRAVLLAALSLVVVPPVARGNVAGSTVTGAVTEPAGGPGVGTEVRLQDAMGAVVARSRTDASGRFVMRDVPAGDYWLVAEAPGPLVVTQRLAARSTRVETTLRLAARAAEAVDVSAEGEGSDVRATFGGDSVRSLEGRLRSRALRDALAAAGGWAREDNGLVHHRGADDGFLFVLDGIPVYERLDPLFGLSPEAATVASFQVLSGYVPPQYGLRSGGVVEMRSLTAAGPKERWGGEGEGMIGSEATRSGAGLLRAPIGSAARALLAGAAERSHRFLDPVDPGNLHNGGHTWATQAEISWSPSARDAFAARGGYGEARFDVPNDEDQDEAGQDQRQRNDDAHASLSWRRVLSSATTSEVALYGRWSRALLLSSPFDTPLQTDANRRLGRGGVLARVTRERGGHRWSAGFEAALLRLDERFAFAVTDPEEGEEADLSEGALAYTPEDPFRFEGARERAQVSFFVQDSWRLTDRLTLDGGLRFDATELLARERRLSPRVGVAFRLSDGVRLRLSANRFFQPPQSEWLLLSASPEARVLSPFAATGGGAPPQAERQWSYEAGADAWLFGRLRFDAAVWHREVTNFLDPNVFFGTTIIFPNSVASGRASGLDFRLELPPRRGLSAFLAYTWSKVTQFGPIDGGLFLEDEILEIGPGTEFTPDHDIPHVLTGAVRYAAPSGRVAATLSGRYQSGPPLEVEDEEMDELAERPGFELVDPAAGRVKPHFVLDASLSVRVLRSRSLELRATLAGRNLTNERFAFNFGNPFSGTHFGPPRTWTLGLQAALP